MDICVKQCAVPGRTFEGALMYIAMNRFKVLKGAESAFENVSRPSRQRRTSRLAP